MKLYRCFRSLSLVVLLSAFVMISGCGNKGEDEPTPTNAELLTSPGEWSAANVTIDGVPTTTFNGMSITFSGDTYTSINGGVIWKPSGTYRFQGDNEFVVDDEFTATITGLTSTSLTLTFNWTKTTLGPGRTSSVAGTYIFTFSK